jgi:hypothetical protein
MATRADQLEAELEVVRLEEQLSNEKTSKGGAKRETKLALREARKAYREARDGVGA